VEPGSQIGVLRVVRGEAVYALTGTVQECRTGGLPLLRVSADGPWQRSQRRSAFRGSVAIRPRSAAVVFGSARIPLRLGITNVSATGVQVRSQDELRRGNLLELAFPIGEDEVEVQARVMRVVKLERVWDAGCVFEGISERTSEQIVQFIFAQQRIALRARRETR
jgi:c-di-GMP-binding flagellar brake protein YcgR